MHRRRLGHALRPAVATLLLGLLGCSAEGGRSSEETACEGWGDPTSIAEVVDRMGELPERTIPCTVRSLERPVDVMAVASVFSAQPGSWYSPRFFLFTDDLVISVVADGPGAHLLEMGEWVVPGQTSLKGELVFPLDDGPPDPYGHLAYGDGTSCGACHFAETPTDVDPLAFVSEAIPPTLGSRVPLSDVWDETQACDDELEPDRCGILRAVMGRNDVNDAVWPTL